MFLETPCHRGLSFSSNGKKHRWHLASKVSCTPPPLARGPQGNNNNKKNPFPRRSHLTPAPSSTFHSLPPLPARLGACSRGPRSERCPGERPLGSARAPRLPAARPARVVAGARVPPTPRRSPPRCGPPAHLARRTPARWPPEAPCPAAHSQAPGTLRHVTADGRRGGPMGAALPPTGRGGAGAAAPDDTPTCVQPGPPAPRLCLPSSAGWEP